MTTSDMPACHGEPPLTARTEPWMEELLANPAACQQLLQEHGSPVNVLDFSALARNAGELTESAAAHGLRLRVFVARKANKTLGLVDAAAQGGLGLDVASLHELQQCLDRGVRANDLIVTAAVKSRELLELAVRSGVIISLDNQDELLDLRQITTSLPEASARVRVALRLAPSDPKIPASRFGLTDAAWLTALTASAAEREALSSTDVHVEGVHFHLNGYSADERRRMLRQACHFVDTLRGRGHPVEFIDMGGGVPMSYLEDGKNWRTFWSALEQDTEGNSTWKGDRLGLTDPLSDRPSAALYPFWQSPVRGPWLDSILGFAEPASAGDDAPSIAQMLNERHLELRCEPGRAVLDGCGMTLASVAFVKQDRDGQGLVGLHMNRTQMRSTSVDVLVDPRWVRTEATVRGESIRGFLVGAYCVEDEAILRRRLTFPSGVKRSDIAAFVNTAGYLMHIVESPSHQLPLAHNVVRHESSWRRDPIDTQGSLP